MAPQRKNLLEAFRQANQADQAASPATPVTPAAPGPPASPAAAEPAPAPDSPAERVAPPATPPVAAAHADAPAEVPPPQVAARPAFSASDVHERQKERELVEAMTTRVPPAIAWGALIVLAFAVGVFVGRRTDRVVAATPVAEPAGGDDGAESVARPAGLVPGTSSAATSDPPASSASALTDPRNEYTIVVATYGGTQEDLAFGTYDHLEAEGLPVHPPYRVGDKIVLLVGASPSSADLEELERRVRGLSREGRAGVYADAYRIQIDRYIQR